MNIADICKRFLHWDTVEVEPVQSGTSNTLYKVNSNASVALVRVYGPRSDQFYDPAYEQLTFQQLSEVGLAPRTLAKGNGWRIEEFIDGVPLLREELVLPSTLALIAVNLARLHKVPLAPREPVSLSRLRCWGHVAPPYIQAELAAMTRSLSKPHFLYDVVFSHNDVQENNMIRTATGLRLIDFEYADFNYRGADVGNLFNEVCYDYTISTPPYFRETSSYPTPEVQRWFAAAYLSEWLETPVYESTHADQIAAFLSEVHVFSQLSHLLWGLWALIRAEHTEIAFDFRKYAAIRFEAYFRNSIT